MKNGVKVVFKMSKRTNSFKLSAFNVSTLFLQASTSIKQSNQEAERGKHNQFISNDS